MRPLQKIAVVVIGYVAAFVLASVAVGIRLAATRGPDMQASSGMYAFGDAVVFVAVFGVAALVPTAAALYFLRHRRRFWRLFSAVSIAVAITGVAAAVLFAVGRDAPPSALASWASASVLRVLVAPLLALGFLVAALFPVDRVSRITLASAMIMEAAVSAYGAMVWFVPLLLDRQ